MRRILLMVALMLGTVGPVSGQSAPRPDPEAVAQTQAQYRDAVIRTRRLETDVAALDRRIAASKPVWNASRLRVMRPSCCNVGSWTLLAVWKPARWNNWPSPRGR